MKPLVILSWGSVRAGKMSLASSATVVGRISITLTVELDAPLVTVTQYTPVAFSVMITVECVAVSLG